MTHPLDGSRAKIARAGDHLESLDAALGRFVKDGGYRFVSEQDPNTEEYVARVYSNLQPPVPPPMSLGVMVGDFLHNLRSALDHVIWQLATSPSMANQFPIFDTPEGFQKKRARYLRSVPEKHWAQIESYQPYEGRNDVLAVLATLNDVDKHRLLLPGVMAIAGHKGRFSGYGVDSMTIKGTGWAPFEDGAEIYRMTIKPSGGPMKVKTDIPYTVVFSDPDSTVGATLQDLRHMRISVANVVESFAPLF